MFVVSLFFISIQCICSSAFITSNHKTNRHATLSKKSILSMAQVELVAEPEGGEELTMIDTMPGCRMKNMGEDTTTKVEDDPDDSTVYDFWFTATVDGALIKGVTTTIEKDASKDANFPGFRKGQIPPYVRPQITLFSIQESIVKTCESAVSAFGLKALKETGDGEGDVDVKEDVPTIAKKYKKGTDIEFTATFKGTYDASKRKIEDVAADALDAVKDAMGGDVIDVVAEPVSKE